MDGYYSVEKAKNFGYVVYETPDGRQVLVTEVVGKGAKPLSIWKDLIYVGTVTKFIEKSNSYL